MTDLAQNSPPAPDISPEQRQPSAEGDGLLAVVKNLSRYHREHEKYYSEAPLADAMALQRAARTLIALAERWTSVEPVAEPEGLDYSILPGQACGLRSSLNDHLGGLPASALPARWPAGADPA
jgi:hypothetical protein